MNHTTSFPPSTTRSYYFQSLTVSSYWLSDIKEKKCFTIFVCFVKNFLYWLFQRDKKTILITQVVIIKLKRLFRGYCNMELITSKYFHPVGITPCVESQFYIVFLHCPSFDIAYFYIVQFPCTVSGAEVQ